MAECQATGAVRLGRLNEAIVDHKRQIRFHKGRLQEDAAARRQLIEKMEQQFGIEVVLVDGAAAEQGVEGTHGRDTATETQDRQETADQHQARPASIPAAGADTTDRR